MSKGNRFIGVKEWIRLQANGWGAMILDTKSNEVKAEKIKKQKNVKFKIYETASAVRDCHHVWFFWKERKPNE